MKCRLTRIGFYIYRRHGTLSFSWRYAWFWWPEWSHDWTGWSIIWLRFGIEWMAFDEHDPWGEKRSSDIEVAWDMLIRDLESDDT